MGAISSSSARSSSAVDGGGAQALTQRVVMGKQAVKARIQRLLIRQIGDADGAAADLVLVSRADAAPGGADFRGTGRLFAQPVKVLMQRQDQRRIFGDHQVFGGDGDALPAELVDFRKQRPGVQHNAIADDRHLALTHDPRGQQRQLIDLIADDQRVAGVMTALKARDHIGAFRQPVNDLALAFVAPLRADDHHIGHIGSLPAVMNAANGIMAQALGGKRIRACPRFGQRAGFSGMGWMGGVLAAPIACGRRRILPMLRAMRTQMLHQTIPAELPRAQGRIRAEFGLAGGVTRRRRLFQSGSAKAMLPPAPGCEMVLLNTSGGLTGGDRMEIDVEQEPGTTLLVTTQTAERAYRSTSGQARVSARFQVGAGGHLDLLPQETILFDRAALHREQDIALEGDATCLWAETLILGRAAMGEVLTRLGLRDRRRITRDGRPIFVENLRSGRRRIGGPRQPGHAGGLPGAGHAGAGRARRRRPAGARPRGAWA